MFGRVARPDRLPYAAVVANAPENGAMGARSRRSGNNHSRTRSPVNRQTINLVCGGATLVLALLLAFTSPASALGLQEEPEGCSACTVDCQYVMLPCMNQCNSIKPQEDCAFSIFPCLNAPGHYRVTCKY